MLNQSIKHAKLFSQDDSIDIVFGMISTNTMMMMIMMFVMMCERSVRAIKSHISIIYIRPSRGGQLKARQVSLGTTKEIVNNLR